MFLKRVFVVCAFLMHAGFLAALDLDLPDNLDVTNWDHVLQHMVEEGLNANEITAVDLRGRGLREIPDWVFTKTRHIIALDLAKNEITSIPGAVGSLERLEILNLFDNRINEVNDNIRHATRLKEIRMSKNELRAIPAAFYSLTDLEYLSLSNNRIASVAPQIANLHKLRVLRLANNPLRRVAPEAARFLEH